MRFPSFQFGFRRRPGWAAWALGAMVLTGALQHPAGAQLSIPAGSAESEGERILRTVTLEQKLNSQVPQEARFKDEQGQVVRFGDYLNKPVMLMMIQFRCTMLCTEELNVLVDSLRKLAFRPGNEFNLVVVSIDPREDALLAKEQQQFWLGKYGRAETEPGWHFLTGDKENIDRLASAVGLHYVYDARTDQYAHPDGVMLISPEGRVSRYYSRLDYPARDLRLGLVEAASNKIGNPIDLITLLCYHYNPSTGKYSLATMKLVRFGAIGTVLLLGASILVMKRRDRAGRRSARAAHEAEG